MSVADIEKAALRIRVAVASSTPCSPIRDIIAAGDIDTAYAVQEVNTRHWLGEGRELVGRKIGLTSVAVQQQLGVDQPDYGMLFRDMAYVSGAEINIERLLQPRAEAEVAFVLGRDLDKNQLNMADLIDAIDYALPAIEVADSRVVGWDITLADTIADNASSGVYVLGDTPRKLAGFDLESCAMVMERRGEVVSEGTGADCLGSPLIATQWLAETMARAGRPLGSGDIVLSGALGPMVAALPGDVFEARIEGLGSVTAVFSGS